MATKTYTWGDGSGDTFTIDYVGNSGQEVASVASQPNETNFHRQGAITLKSTDNEEVQVDVVQLCSAGGLAVLNTSAIPGASSTPYVRYFNGLYIWTDGVASRGTRVRYSTDGDTYTEWWCDESGTGINAYPYYENGTYYVFSAISSKPFVYKSTGVGEAFTLVDGV